jgi:hypothetical protein
MYRPVGSALRMGLLAGQLFFICLLGVSGIPLGRSWKREHAYLSQ